jgi:hypothetical protein
MTMYADNEVGYLQQVICGELESIIVSFSGLNSYFVLIFNWLYMAGYYIYQFTMPYHTCRHCHNSVELSP